MPIYEYNCETCGLDFEIEQAFSEDTLVKCPTKKSGRNPEGCKSSGRGRVTKVFSAPGISFKGGGFYKTDSRSGSSSSADSAASSSGSSSDKSTSSSSSDSSSSSSSDKSSSSSSGDSSSKKKSDSKTSAKSKSSS